MNWSVLYASLQVFDHRDWLGDTRVELCAASSLEKLCYPFAALPACMRLADEAAARLRDWAVLDLATPFARQGFAKRSETYRQHMAENEAMLSGDGDVAELFGTADGRPIVVAAAGPTLADNYGWLRQNRSDFILIAVDAALIPLLEAGIEPDIVIAIDGSATGIPPYFATDLSRMHNHVLVYFPIVAPSVIQQWPGARACAYTDHALYADIRKRLPRADLFASGTVLHAAVDLAVQMGSTEIHLLGVDFSFPRGRTHVEGAAHTGDAPEAGTWVLNGYGERVPTLANMCAYLRDLERYLLRHPQVQFFNHSRAGAYIEGCRYIDGQAP